MAHVCAAASRDDPSTPQMVKKASYEIALAAYSKMPKINSPSALLKQSK